jgi:hypothetical protein
LCRGQAPPERVLVDVVREDALAVDLHDGQPLAVARLELRVAVDRHLVEHEPELVPERAHLLERPLAEVTAGRVEDRYSDGLLYVIQDSVGVRGRAHA